MRNVGKGARLGASLLVLLGLYACEANPAAAPDTAGGGDTAAGTDATATTDVLAGTDAAAGTDATAQSDSQAGTDAQTGSDSTSGSDAAAETDAAAQSDVAAGTDAIEASDTAEGSDTTEPGSDATADPDTNAATDVSTGSDDASAGSDTAAGTDAAAGDTTAELIAQWVDLSLDSTQLFAADAQVTLKATLQTPPGVVLSTAKIVWGDGSSQSVGPLQPGANLQYTHQYTALGTYPVVVEGCVATLCKSWPIGSVQVVCALPDHDDCNSAIADGCEADLTSDEYHCGGCNKPCGAGFGGCRANDICENSACVVQPATAGTECRPASGDCDVAETCDGASVDCPADLYASASTTCRESNGLCDVAETCSGDSPTCPADTFASGVECRAQDGDCDVAEACDGSSAECPADALAGSDVVCRAAAEGGCDIADYCSGASKACGFDLVASEGTECRASTGGCDPAETCKGDSTACPADSFAAVGETCRPADGPCDVAETCSGGAECPADGFANSGVCRPEAGPCDVAESCDGSGADCPTDAFSNSGETIEPGPCGTGGICDGTSATGGSVLEPAGTVCAPSQGDCDPAEVCDGASTQCPTPSYAWFGKLCRAATNGCDIPEYCGTGPDCPAESWNSQYDLAGKNYAPCNENLNVCISGTCSGAPFFGVMSNNICDGPDGIGGKIWSCSCSGPGDGAVAAVSYDPTPMNLYATVLNLQTGQNATVAVDPSTIPGGIRLTGRWKVENLKDRFNVITRDGQGFHGVAFYYDPVSQTYGISGIGNAEVTAGPTATAPLAVKENDMLAFAITDDGNNVSAKFWVEPGDAANATKVTATCSTKPFRIAGPIRFLATNDAYQSSQIGEVLDVKIEAVGGAVKPTTLWSFEAAPNNSTVLANDGSNALLQGAASWVNSGTSAGGLVSLDGSAASSLNIGAIAGAGSENMALGFWIWADLPPPPQTAVSYPILSSSGFGLTWDGSLLTLEVAGYATTAVAALAPQSWTYVHISHEAVEFAFPAPATYYVWRITTTGELPFIGPYAEVPTPLADSLVFGAAPLTNGAPARILLDDVRVYTGKASPVTCAPAPNYTPAL